MAEWCQLPTDLLTLIGKSLKSQFDQLRFRSVCTSWRHSLTPPPSPRLSILPNNGISETSWGFYLSKRTILSLSSPHYPSQSWLIKIEQDNPLITHLVNPLTSSQFDLTLGDTLDIPGTKFAIPTPTHVDLSQLDLNLGLPQLSDSMQVGSSMQVGVPESGSKNNNPMQTHLNSSHFDLSLGLTEASDSTQIGFSGSSSKQENSMQVGVSKSGLENDNLAQTYVDLSQTDSVLGFPKTLDLMPIRVTELGFEYILRYINYRPFASSISDAGNLYMEKVALFFDSRIGYVLLTIHVSGKLVMFKIGDKKWTIVQDFPSPYDDVVLFNGRFYAVDNTGRAVVVSLDASNSFAPVVEMVADPIFGGDKKTMVVSSGELLLVDTYLSVGPEDDTGFEEEVEFYEEFDCYMSERTVRFKVFRLDWGGKKWDEVKDLGDRMLFLGDYCTFSAPASDFDGCNGNCIIFADRTFYSSRQEEEEDGAVKGRGVGVFNLESGSIGFLGGFPGYSKMFWPPPSWVYSSSTTLEDDLNHLGI